MSDKGFGYYAVAQYFRQRNHFMQTSDNIGGKIKTSVYILNLIYKYSRNDKKGSDIIVFILIKLNDE